MKRKSKRKIRNRRRFLILIIIIIVIFVMFKKDKTKENNNTEITKSYVNNIINNSDEVVKSEWEKLIISYLDLYTASLEELKSRDVTKLFTESKGVEAFLTQTTIDTQVYHHSKQLNDMRLKKAYYDIEYRDVSVKNNKITIRFLEDDYYQFKYLDDITSRLIDIENTIVINDNNGNYTIDSLRVLRDNYVIFTNVIEGKITKEKIVKLNEKYLKYIDEEASKNKDLFNYASKNKYVSSKECSHEYDRDTAVNYSYKYVDNRNDNYLDYSSLGGNCANYASQSIFEGGIPMDYEGSYQWKYFSDELNDDNTERGRSSSWVSTYYFYDYAKNNDGFGMCAEVDVNIFYAQIGDVIHVGYKNNSYSHTTLVSKIIKKDNKTIDILVNSNTTGLKDYPIFGYIYQNKRLIKILGYND